MRITMVKQIHVLVLLACTLLTASACNKNASVSNLTTTPNPTDSNNSVTADTNNTCDSPSTTTLWKGERSVATTVAVRGAWSDMALIPNSTYPAIAYTDAGCSCLKFTYWDGTDWTTEVISAGSSTSYSFVRLAYLSSGVPIVVWSNSTTTLQMAIRSSASLSASATWTVTNLDTAGTAIRALELKVNPNDQVAILYARNTAGTSHLILCTSSCDSGTNYSSPSSSLGTVGTTPQSLGLGWCNSGSAYYPVIGLTGATNSGFAVCRQSSLSSCLTGIASWAGGALQNFTGSGANRATLQLAIDQTNTDAPIRAIVNNGSALAYYQSSFTGGGCATGTVAAISSGGTISGTAATSGNAYLSLQQTSDGNFHLMANESTTSVRYYNTTTASFTTWNAQGTVATATLAAAGSTRGGFAVDESLSQAYTTFARTAAANPFNGNLMFGWIENTTVASSAATAEFYETPLTTDGQIQSLTNQVPNISIAADSSGKPAVAFVDYSANSATAGILKYAIRNGSLSSDSWIMNNVPVVAQPQAVALAFDKNDKPWIAFFDQQTLRYRLTTNTAADGSGTWTSYYFPLRSAVTAATAPAHHSVALAMDLSSSTVTPVMLIGVANHGTVATTGIWSARLNPETGNWSNITQLKSTNAANSNSNLNADFDSSGKIVVTYYDRNANRIEYVHSTNGGVAWSTPTQVSSLTANGMGAKIKLNPSNSRPAITYFDRANNRVFYSSCTSAIASCSSVANWTYSIVENLSAGVSGLASTSDGLLNTGLTFTSTGVPYVIYPVGSGNSGALAINTNSSGSFPLSSTLVAGKNASTLSNSTISAINFGQAGWNVDSVRTVKGSVHSAYVGPGNWLYLTSCGN